MKLQSGGETRHEVWEHIFSNDCTLKKTSRTKIQKKRSKKNY